MARKVKGVADWVIVCDSEAEADAVLLAYSRSKDPDWEKIDRLGRKVLAAVEDSERTTHATLLALVAEALNAADILEKREVFSLYDNNHVLADGLRTKANAAMDALREESWEPEDTDA